MTTTKKAAAKSTQLRPQRQGRVHSPQLDEERRLPRTYSNGRPVIGICNTWSELTPCNAGLRDLAEHVKRGVWEAGGLPLEFPAMSLGETQMRPTAMLFRNLLAMEVEESIRRQPHRRGGIARRLRQNHAGSADGGGERRSSDARDLQWSDAEWEFRGCDIGSGTDVWKFSRGRARRASCRWMTSWPRNPECRARPGTCMTMGSASTMACMMEAMGLALPFNATAPAVDAQRRRIAHGERPADRAHGARGCAPLDDFDAPAFENAIRVLGGIGGSTNTVLHCWRLPAGSGAVGVGRF